MRGKEVVVEEKAREGFEVAAAAPYNEVAVWAGGDNHGSLLTVLRVEGLGLARAGCEPQGVADAIDAGDAELAREVGGERGAGDDGARGDDELVGC